MSLRPPGQYSNPGNVSDSVGLLDYEIAAEKAAALGRAGGRVERCWPSSPRSTAAPKIA